MATIKPNVALYSQHISQAGYIRSIITSVKALLDDATFRQNLIYLDSVEGDLSAEPFPLELQGRTAALSAALVDFENTLSTIEGGIRGAVLYPRQV